MTVENYSPSIQVTNVVQAAKIILDMDQNALDIPSPNKTSQHYIECLRAALYDYLQDSSSKNYYSIDRLERDIKTLLTCTNSVLPLLTQEARSVLSDHLMR